MRVFFCCSCAHSNYVLNFALVVSLESVAGCLWITRLNLLLFDA